MSKELARRAVACKGWHWMAGMLAVGDDGRAYRVVEDRTLNGLALHQVEGRRLRQSHPSLSSLLPDPFDPATLGCLLALVREAFPERIVWTEIEYTTRQWIVVIMYNDGESGIFTRANTEAEALVDALEAVSDD